MHFVARTVVALACAAALQVASAQSRCGRACLESLADRYLDALVAHAPGRLPLGDDVKFTENGQTLAVGAALFATASAAADERLYVTDPDTGQIAFLVALEEHGGPAMLAARLRVRNGRVVEIEHVVARFAPGPDARRGSSTARLFPSSNVPPEARVPRAALVGIADSYFDALDELDSAQRVPFHEACRRVQNGAEDADDLRALGCADQLDTGYSRFVSDVRERRFPVVDEVRGLVFAIARYDHAGGVDAVELADGATFEVPVPYRSPSARLTGQIFRIEGGQIRRIEAVLADVPYRMPAGW